MDLGTSQNNYPNYVLGFFENYSDAENAIHDLSQAGIAANRIGLATRENGVPSRTTKEGESFWQKIANFFEGKDQSAGSDATTMNPDVAPYGKNLEQDGVLVSVSTLTPEEHRECEEIFEAHDGQIEQAGTTSGLPSQSGSDSDGNTAAQRIQLLSEVLRVHKERVSTGEVRLRKQVITENRSIDVPVTREELVLERQPVEKTGVASREIGGDQEIRVPLSEEQVRVEKRPIVKEEVRVGKKKVQESRQVNEQVRREELHVDREGDVNTERKKGIA